MRFQSNRVNFEKKSQQMAPKVWKIPSRQKCPVCKKLKCPACKELKWSVSFSITCFVHWLLFRLRAYTLCRKQLIIPSFSHSTPRNSTSLSECHHFHWLLLFVFLYLFVCVCFSISKQIHIQRLSYRFSNNGLTIEKTHIALLNKPSVGFIAGTDFYQTSNFTNNLPPDCTEYRKKLHCWVLTFIFLVGTLFA